MSSPKNGTFSPIKWQGWRDDLSCVHATDRKRRCRGSNRSRRISIPGFLPYPPSRPCSACSNLFQKNSRTEGVLTPLPSIPNLLSYQRSTLVFCLFVAGVEGFEPPTIGFGDRCSTNWNYTPKTHSNYRI